VATNLRGFGGQEGVPSLEHDAAGRLALQQRVQVLLGLFHAREVTGAVRARGVQSGPQVEDLLTVDFAKLPQHLKSGPVGDSVPPRGRRPCLRTASSATPAREQLY